MDVNAYSRFVAWAKVLLPLAALALLATLFLIARRIDPSEAIPFAEVDVEQFAREARIGAPELSGVTDDGTVISLAAEVARPDPAEQGRMVAEGLTATFEIPDGSRIEAAAGAGSVDGASRRVHLTGGVEVITSTGYRIAAEGLSADLTTTSIVSDGRVTAEGPAGRLEAGGVALGRAVGDAGGYVLVFNDGVRLVYEPAAQGK